MELTESQIYEGFGLEQPQAQETPAEQEPEQHQAQETPDTQELGQPQAKEAQATQEPEQHQAQAAPDTQESGQPQDQEAQATQETEKTAKGEMSLEQRRENAARRRRAETRAAVDEAVAAERRKYDAELKSFFESAGLKNTLTGEPIQSMEQYNAWKRDFEGARLDKALKGGGLTQEALDAAIKNNPVVQQAAQLVEKARAQEERQRLADMENRVAAEMDQIRQLNPNIQSVSDLLTMPRAKEFYQLVKRGNSFLDAYKLAHYDQLTQQAVDAARQQAVAAGRQQAQNLARSKGHLTAGSQRGVGASTVPAREMDMFRVFNPQASEADIQAYYNKYQGGK